MDPEGPAGIDGDWLSELADVVYSTWDEGCPAGVRDRSVAATLNMAACVIHGMHSPTLRAALHAMRPLEPRDTDVLVPGTDDRVSPECAALLMGAAGDIDDFNDTHLATVTHPGVSVFPAAWVAGVGSGLPPRRMLDAYAIGCEVQIRFGLALGGEHFRRGWHTTTTTGAIGAFTAAALLYGLPRDRWRHGALVACMTAAGTKESWRTSAKLYQQGAAPAAGLRIALETQRDRDWRIDLLRDPGPILAGLYGDPREYRPAWLRNRAGRWNGKGAGSGWQFEQTMAKPYPSGIVGHPLIDAGIALHGHVPPDEITAIDVACNPTVTSLMWTTHPTTQEEATLSAAHVVAAALTAGRFGLAEVDEPARNDDGIARLRGLVRLRPDESVALAAATVTVHLRSGGQVTRVIEFATGSRENPMTPTQLQGKVDDLIEAVLPGRARTISDAFRRIPTMPSFGPLVEACTPRTR